MCLLEREASRVKHSNALKFDRSTRLDLRGKHPAMLDSPFSTATKLAIHAAGNNVQCEDVLH